MLAAGLMVAAMHPMRKWRMSLPPELRSLGAAGRLLGVSGSQIHRYENKARRVPPEKVIVYESITGIPRWVLRPDIYPPERRRGRKPASHKPALEMSAP